MQFSVPQFTDVEDRLIANLSFKQFGIIFGTGAFVFVIYTLSKSVPLAIAFAVVLGVPALLVAFGKVNGRPIYSMFGSLLSYFMAAKTYVFHKEASSMAEEEIIKATVKEEPPPLSAQAAAVRIKQIGYLLQQQVTEEQVLLRHIKKHNDETARR